MGGRFEFWGFLLQSRRGVGETGPVLLLPLGSAGGVVTGLGGVGGGTRLGGCGDERRGGAGGGTGRGDTGAVRCGTGGGCGDITGWIIRGGGGCNKKKFRPFSSSFP